MIANLVSTLLLALGVATGNVSSNVYKSGNAFNHEIEIPDKKPKKEAQRYININESYNKISEYNYTNNGTVMYSSKWAINNTQSNYIYYNDYLNIANTTYQYITETYLVEVFHILEITNYNDSTLSITITDKVYMSGNTSGTSTYKKGYKYYTNNSYVDLTLNSSLYSTLINLYDNDATEYAPEVNGTIANTQNMISDQTTVELQANETFKLIHYTGRYDPSTDNVFTGALPENLTITGTADVQEINYEVIDIPNLMYTILTLPFAWYSTAFNLTVFPNTPYAINFGNIILTIVAAMILMYLIKKVIK